MTYQKERKVEQSETLLSPDKSGINSKNLEHYVKHNIQKERKVEQSETLYNAIHILRVS